MVHPSGLTNLGLHQPEVIINLLHTNGHIALRMEEDNPILAGTFPLYSIRGLQLGTWLIFNPIDSEAFFLTFYVQLWCVHNRFIQNSI